jgi:hypothetical protein
VECKSGRVNFRRVSDPRRAFGLTFAVTGIYGDLYRSTMGDIVISLGIPGSARENFAYTWEYLVARRTNLGVPVTCLRLPPIKVEQSENNNIFFGNNAGASGHYSYYIAFNKFENSFTQFVF